GGGAAVVCDDGNPCTLDSCDAVTGCRHTLDAAAVPDDGVACTIGSCASGAPVFTPSDAACDDGLYCTGVERCQPSAPGRDARGCVRSEVPEPPGPSQPCAYYATCDEATRGFPLVRLPMGAACDDGIACTSLDVCQSEGGACAGTPTASCAGLECSSSVPWSSTIDIPSAQVSGALTLDGAAIPSEVPSNGYGTATVWAVSRETGVRHRLAELRHTNYQSSTGGYRLVVGDASYQTLLVPGVYDLLYERQASVNSNGSGDRWVGRVTPGALMPSGWRVLREGVVIGAGASTLNVDIASAQVSGALTLDGAAIPSEVPSNGYGTATVWAVSRETGVRHRLAELRHTNYQSSTGGYRLVVGDASYQTLLVPGVYDLLYERQTSVNSNGSGDRWVGRVTPGALMPSGWRVLRQCVEVR
ncbi:MAG: hypothetical protein KF901_24550, partial [Myxococcales bacterium]|nr:hypothetical protein [Myxococcales bacterium]